MDFSWNELAKKKTISVLAPMEEVTDTVFRQMMLSMGKPDVFFTEFTSLEGLFSPGEEKVAKRLRFSDIELPLVAQIWGTTPKLYQLGAQKLSLLGFSGVDINMGCPDKDVVKTGACSALINNPTLASEIINATKEGSQGLPLSIKTRIGFQTIVVNEWIGHLLEHKPNAISIHLRTSKELSLVPPHYELMKEISKLRDEISKDTVLICNGDILTVEQGEILCKENSFEGYMIGRGVFKNPYLFDNRDFNIVPISEKIMVLEKHVELFKKIWGETKNYDILKKYFKIYVNNFERAKEIREQLMNTKTLEQGLIYIKELRQKYSA